jgi:DeoR/GlpR family transcriptional regulator of sugar metabolism
MTNRNRLEEIRKYLTQNQSVGISEISQQFNISIATARRDLDQLAENGEVLRVRGGAQLAKKAPPEPPVLQRCNDQPEEKLRIARMAASLIQPGETLLLGGGSTVYELARQLDDRPGITVVTASLLVINALSNYQDIQLVTLGGFFRPSELISFGHVTETTLSDLYVDKVFYGVRAISLERGLTNDYLSELSTDRMMLSRGKEIIILVDHTKFNRESTSLVGPLSLANKIITDDKAPKETIEAIRAQGIEVLIA